MRIVAVMLATLSFVATLPTSAAADECANTGAVGSFCVPLDTRNYPLPPTAYTQKYYIWIGAGHCFSPLSGDCTGSPEGEGSGIPTPVGTVKPAHVFSVLFRETNGVHGLQRSSATAGGRQPDATVLL